MRKLLILGLIAFVMNAFGQSGEKISYLDFAGNKIEVPKKCQAKSEYELMDCDGISIQWLYLDQSMQESVPRQLVDQLSTQSTTKKREEITLESYGSELSGYKFQIKDLKGTSYRIIVYGTVNDQPLLLNIGSKSDIKKTSDLNSFLKKIISVKHMED